MSAQRTIADGARPAVEVGSEPSGRHGVLGVWSTRDETTERRSHGNHVTLGQARSPRCRDARGRRRLDRHRQCRLGCRPTGGGAELLWHREPLLDGGPVSGAHRLLPTLRHRRIERLRRLRPRQHGPLRQLGRDLPGAGSRRGLRRHRGLRSRDGQRRAGPGRWGPGEELQLHARGLVEDHVRARPAPAGGGHVTPPEHRGHGHLAGRSRRGLHGEVLLRRPRLEERPLHASGRAQRERRQLAPPGCHVHRLDGDVHGLRRRADGRQAEEPPCREAERRIGACRLGLRLPVQQAVQRVARRRGRLPLGTRVRGRRGALRGRHDPPGDRLRVRGPERDRRSRGDHQRT